MKGLVIALFALAGSFTCGLIGLAYYNIISGRVWFTGPSAADRASSFVGLCLFTMVVFWVAAVVACFFYDDRKGQR